MALRKQVENALSPLCEERGLTLNEAVIFLYAFYNLEHIDQIIDQIKKKHLALDLTASQKAALRVLATYIDLI